ncbi:MAG: SIMPL domain-containing protein [Gemmatimonadota bacterium]
MRTSKAALTLATVMAAISLPSVGASQPPTAPAPRSQIVVSARGETRVVPDRATLTVAVETRGQTAAAAGQENARRQRAIIDSIKAAGIPDAQISTSGYNVWPEYAHAEGRPPRVTGYRAHNSVAVEIRRIDQVGRVIDAALAAGANNLSGVSMFVSDTDSARRNALRSAVTRARADAEVLAQAAGGSLGELLELTSVEYQVPPPRPLAYARAAAMQAEVTPIEPGEQTVSAAVTARWAFNPGR